MLVIQFDRVEHNSWYRTINTNYIEFPMCIDLTPYVINPNASNCTYSLNAVLVSLPLNHPIPPPLPSNPTDPFYQNFSNRAYSACVQNKNDKAWYAFSEENGCIDYQLGT